MSFSLITVIIALLIIGTLHIRALNDTIDQHRFLKETIQSYALKVIKVREARITDLKDLVKTYNKELSLLYTLQKTGIKAETLEEVREIIKLTKNLPIGSPFINGHIITSPAGRRDESRWNGDGIHYGIDLVNQSGSKQVNLTADGKIVEFGYSETYGKYVIIDTEHGYRLKYAHLKTIFYQDELGNVLDIPLKKGQRIGIMGDTGLTTGAHLHYEIMIWNELTNEYLQLDPEEILNYIGE